MGLASVLVSVQRDKPLCNYFIARPLVQNLLNMKYFVLKFAIPGKVGEHEVLMVSYCDRSPSVVFVFVGVFRPSVRPQFL